MKKILLLLLFITSLAQAQIINFPDANFKAKLLSADPTNNVAHDGSAFIKIDANNDGEIEVSEAQAVINLEVTSASIVDLTGISNFSNLNSLNCFYNQLTTLDITGLNNLSNLYCRYNQITTINLNGLNNLNILDCSENQLTFLDLTGLNNLGSLACNNNQLTSLDLSALINLSILNCGNNPLGGLNLAGLINLTNLECKENQLDVLDLTGLNSLSTVDCSRNSLSALNLIGLNNLTYLDCGINLLSALDVTALSNLTDLSCYSNQLTSLDITGLINLLRLNFNDNQIASINLNGPSNLDILQCDSNQLTSLDLTGVINLAQLYCDSNQLTSLDLSGLNNLIIISCSGNQLNSLDFTGLSVLADVICIANQLITLDFKDNPNLEQLDCSNNNIATIYIKNGGSIVPISSTGGYSDWSNNPLSYVCIDESESANVQDIIAYSSLANVNVNTYCSFTPGGDFNSITGTAIFDSDNNGCDASDFLQPLIKLKMNDGTSDEFAFADENGVYTFYSLAGNFVVSPDVENPSFFNFSPANTTVNFPVVDNSVATQNFCMSANGVHPDVEVVIASRGIARPGFDSEYIIVYKNKGNQLLSGNVNITYDDNVLDFVSATVMPDTQSTGTLSWNYTNLRPFENKVIYVTLNLNSPTETPAVNSGDILDFTATVNPIPGDELPLDNVFEFHQTVVNSLDPNIKQCLEGDIVSPSEIGNYLHYVIDFENIGTTEAENIVVKDIIDLAKFDIKTLQIMNSSHEVEVNVKGNVIEFVFKGIKLPAGGHGNILLKIKTKNDLVVGDVVTNKAEIFFDYNYPIDTNTARTTFQSLGINDYVTDQSVSVYPNPSKGNVSVKANGTIKSVQLFDIQGRVLETRATNESELNIDISKYSNGVYFLKVLTDVGIKIEKLIRE